MFFIKFKRLLPVDKLTISVIFICLISVLGCGVVERLFEPTSQISSSVFSEFQHRNCAIIDGAGQQQKIACSDLAPMAFEHSPACRESEVNASALGIFPGQKVPMRLCQPKAPKYLKQSESLRFFVFGDSGRGEDPSRGYGQQKVADGLRAICFEGDRPTCDFGLVVGDMIYPKGPPHVFDKRFKIFFEQIYQDFGQMPFYAVAGNHDHHGNIQAEIEYTYFSERWRFFSLFYHLDFLPDWIKIVGLDTSSLIAGETLKETTEAQRNLTKETLCGESESWHMLFGHHPSDASGKHGGNFEIRDFLSPVEEDCGIDFYFAGHEHHQEHIKVDGYDVILQGGGGTSIRKVRWLPDLDRQHFAYDGHGFAIVEATPTQIDVYFYGVDVWKYQGTGFARPVSRKDYIYHCRALKGGPSGCMRPDGPSGSP